MFVKDEIGISRIELKKLVNFLPYPILISEKVENDYVYLFFNKNFIKKIGYSLNDVTTRHDLVKLIYPDETYRSTILNEWIYRENLVKEAGKGFVKIKALVTCKSGEQKWFEIKGSIVNELHIIAFVDIHSDVLLQEKLKMKNLNNERMLSILGHDMRSPIANLISISSLGEQSEISQQEFISMMQFIKEESTEVLQLLDTTFNWARLNFNNFQHEYTFIDFNVLINNILKGCKPGYESKNITIDVDVHKLDNVVNDREILTVVIRNLISNAIKFTSKNGVISISATKNELTITDNGIGMSSEMVDGILSQNYSTRRGTDNEKGIGVGLQLVMNLLEKINCKMVINSKVLRGTEVRIIFNSIENF